MPRGDDVSAVVRHLIPCCRRSGKETGESLSLPMHSYDEILEFGKRGTGVAVVRK